MDVKSAPREWYAGLNEWLMSLAKRTLDKAVNFDMLNRLEIDKSYEQETSGGLS
jgi:hypothetical protein